MLSQSGTFPSWEGWIWWRRGRNEALPDSSPARWHLQNSQYSSPHCKPLTMSLILTRPSLLCPVWVACSVAIFALKTMRGAEPGTQGSPERDLGGSSDYNESNRLGPSRLFPSSRSQPILNGSLPITSSSPFMFHPSSPFLVPSMPYLVTHSSESSPKLGSLLFSILSVSPWYLGTSPIHSIPSYYSQTLRSKDILISTIEEAVFS